MLKSNYECTPDELYITCRMGWQSCLDHLDKFSAFSSKYNERYVKACEEAIDTACKLQVTQSRNYRARLIEKAELALSNWERLKRYIINTFPEAEVPKLLKAAGEEYYEKAAAYDWDNLKELLNAGCGFIKKHGKKLKANKNMPGMFQKICVSIKDETRDLYKKYQDGIAQEAADTRKKIKANNAIYKDVKKMFSDAEKIFSKDDITRSRFNFDELLSFAKRSNYLVASSPAGNSAVKPVASHNLNQKYTMPVFLR